jgi:hypothetical protein
MEFIMNLPTVDELIKMFQKINSDCRATDGEEFVTLSDWEFYSDQIFAIYEDSKITHEEAEKLAKEMAEKVTRENISSFYS